MIRVKKPKIRKKALKSLILKETSSIIKRKVRNNIIIYKFLEILDMKIKEFKESLTNDQIETLRSRQFTYKEKEMPIVIKKTPPKKIKYIKPKNPYCTSDYRYRDWKEIYLNTKKEDVE